MKKRTKTNHNSTKKAQITIFIIIGISIVLIAGIAIYMSKVKMESDLSKKFFAQENIKPELNNVQDSIINCMETVSFNSLETIGIQGGFYKRPSTSLITGPSFIPYYYDSGAIFMPSKNQVSEELESYFNENIGFCLQEVVLGEFTLDYPNPKTTVIIEKSKVIFNINIPITIEREGHKTKFETKKHQITQNSKLFEILEIANFITESHKDDPNLLCLNCIAEMALERDVYVDMLEFNPTTTQIIIIENKTGEEPYIFEFLNKY
jgi:hypothetical protein